MPCPPLQIDVLSLLRKYPQMLEEILLSLLSYFDILHSKGEICNRNWRALLAISHAFV